MSRRADGAYRCDRCDLDVGNAGAAVCSKVTDMTASGDLLMYDFCRAPRVGAPRGCTGLTFGPATLAAYTASHATP